MKRSSGADLDVFNFNEEDELTEPVSLKWNTLKRKNPRLDNSPSTKYQFLECLAGGAKLPLRGNNNVKRADIVTIEEGSRCSSDRSNCMGMPVDGSADDRVVGSHAISDNLNLMDGELRVGSSKDSSTENCHASSTILENRLVVDGSSDGGDSIEDSSPCTSDSVPMESNVPTDGEIQDHCYNDFEMQVEMEPTVIISTDYVAYREEYYPASLMIFSKNSIKMKNSSAYQDVEMYLSSWDVDDIVNVHSQWSRRSKLATVRVSLQSKDASLTDKVQEVSGIDELKFVVYDPDWRQKQEAIMLLHERYEAAWDNTMDFDCESNGEVLPDKRRELYSGPYLPDFHEPFEDVVYPEGDPDAVSISKRDVDLLQPETFINDTIIDFYIKYLKNMIPLEKRQHYHFFNSFFFRKLADLDKNPSSAFDGKAAFLRVRKWTRKINLFEKDYIFIPVNYNLHWSLIVICHASEVANVKDEDLNLSLKVPCILHMDSIRGNHSGLKDLVQSYLWEEWKERHKGASEEDSSAFLNLRFISLELPQQENCYDCGLFLLHYVELFLAEAPENFSPFQITKFSNFLNANWFMAAEVSLKRAHIQRLIHKLLENCSPGSVPKSCSDEVHTSNVLCHHGNDRGTEFVSGICNLANVYNANSFHSQPGQMDGMTMLGVGVSSSGTSHCLSEPGFQLAEPRNSSGSTFRQYQQYDLGPLCGRSMGTIAAAMPTIVEEVEANEDMIYSSEDIELGISLRMDGFQLEGCSTTCPSSYLGPVKASKPIVTGQVENRECSSPSSCYQSDDSEELMMFEAHPTSSCYQNDHMEKGSEHFSDPAEYNPDFYSSKMNLNEHGFGKAPSVSGKENLGKSQFFWRNDVSAPLECNDDSSSQVPDCCLDDLEIKSKDWSGGSTFARQKDGLDLSKCSFGEDVPILLKGHEDSSGVPNTKIDDSAEELDGESLKDKGHLHQMDRNEHSRCSSELAVSVRCDPGSSAVPVSGTEMNEVENSDPSEKVDQLNGETINSAPESFSSASSEIFGTPDVSQELGNADEDPSVRATILQPSHEEATIDDSHKGTCAGIHLVADDSFSGSVEEQSVKKMQFSPPTHRKVLLETPNKCQELDEMHDKADDDPPVQATMLQLSHEEVNIDCCQKGTSVGNVFVVDDSSSDSVVEQAAKKIQLSPPIHSEVALETPNHHDSQELDKVDDYPDQDLPLQATILRPSQGETNIEDSQKGACAGNLLVDDSSSYFVEEQAARKTQLSPLIHAEVRLETPTHHDSQELDKVHDHPVQATMLRPSHEEVNVDDSQKGACVGKLLVDDSSSDFDEEQVAQKMQPSPPTQDPLVQETMLQPSQVESIVDERTGKSGKRVIVDNSSSDSDDEHASKRMRLLPLAQRERSPMRN